MRFNQQYIRRGRIVPLGSSGLRRDALSEAFGENVCFFFMVRNSPRDFFRAFVVLYCGRVGSWFSFRKTFPTPLRGVALSMSLNCRFYTSLFSFRMPIAPSRKIYSTYLVVRCASGAAPVLRLGRFFSGTSPRPTSSASQFCRSIG